MPEPLLDFFAVGTPKPAGSKTPFVFTDRHGNPKRRAGGSVACGVRDSSGAAGDRWRKAVVGYGRQAWDGPPIQGPLRVCFEFVVERPKFHYGTGRNEGVVKATSPRWPTVAPDTTKLTRAAEDALTGVVWVDDAQIVEQIATKRYATRGEHAGVRVVVELMDDGQAGALFDQVA